MEHAQRLLKMRAQPVLIQLFCHIVLEDAKRNIYPVITQRHLFSISRLASPFMILSVPITQTVSAPIAASLSQIVVKLVSSTKLNTLPLDPAKSGFPFCLIENVFL